MQWYYAKQNQQAGPVSDEQLQALVSDGTIGPDTLVWHEGMDQWKAYSAVAPGDTAAAPAATPTFRRPTAQLHLAKPASASCTQCGRSVPADTLVQKGEAMLCAACEEAVGQFLRPAGFWIRALAKLIDGIILNIIIGVIVAICIMMLIGGIVLGNLEPIIKLVRTIALPLTALQAIYMTLLVGKFGATPGKMALRLVILRADGSPVSYGRALGRFFAEFLSSILCIGYIMAAFDADKRALHDRICGTLVVHKA